MPKRTNKHGQTEVSSNVYLSEDDHLRKVNELMNKLKKSKTEIIRMGIDLVYKKETND